MRFQVFESGKPAQYPDCNVHPSWSNSIFNTWEDANKYANHWLGPYGGIILISNIPHDFSGYGDTIEIWEIE